MKKIVAYLRPFDLKQNFYIYEDGEKIASAAVEMKDIPNIVLGFTEEYGVYQLDLAGPKQYAKGIKKNIEEVELTKNSTNKIEINLI